MPVTVVTVRPHSHLETFRRDVLKGLSGKLKSIPAKYFYDHAGSELFEEICGLPEYYLTRTELQIMQASAAEMGRTIGSDRILLELGSGLSIKSRLLIAALQRPMAYVPVDISPSALSLAVETLSSKFPGLAVRPIIADFQSDLRLPAELKGLEQQTVAYFPGSTIGNLSPAESVKLLNQLRMHCAGGGMMIGIDLQKDVDILKRAYNDKAGVTAEFNRNLLRRVNCELDGGFDLELFEHRAIYNQECGRIEMHLVSLVEQSVQVAGMTFDFAAGESICTEHSHKFTLRGFERLAQQAGWEIQQVWTDPLEWFAVVALRQRGGRTFAPLS